MLNNLSITTRGIDEQTFNIGTATQTGAAFPYLKVACGEPRDVWEMSAPLVIVYLSNLACGLSSCSKDDDGGGPKITVKNLTGIDWYDASVIFKESTDASSQIVKMVEIGDVPMGKSFTVTKESDYFYIDAYNNRGKLLMTDIVAAYNNKSLTNRDVLINL